jgi:hypothetical protein
MNSIAQHRRSYLIIRWVALVIQLGGLICLTPIKQYGDYPERIAGFVSLSLIAWFLNLCCRQTHEYQRRMMLMRLRAYRRREFVVSVLAMVFAVMSFVYLQVVPTWPILAISLSVGGCTGYVLTNI